MVNRGDYVEHTVPLWSGTPQRLEEGLLPVWPRPALGSLHSSLQRKQVAQGAHRTPCPQPSGPTKGGTGRATHCRPLHTWQTSCCLHCWCEVAPEKAPATWVHDGASAKYGSLTLGGCLACSCPQVDSPVHIWPSTGLYHTGTHSLLSCSWPGSRSCWQRP